MPPAGNVRFIKQRDLDRSRWDAAVASDTSSLPYGFSWWLDAVAGHHWDGMVLGDYRAVLPLVKHLDFGLVSTIHRPPFTQQCGPWGTINEEELHDLLQSIPRSFLHLDMPLNFRCSEKAVPTKFSFERRTNFIIDLSRPYETIKSGYSKTLRRKLRRYGEDGKLIDVKAEKVIDLYRAGPGKKAGLKAKHYKRMRLIMGAAKKAKLGNLYGFQNAQGELLAAGFFPQTEYRLINLFATSTQAGYAAEGMSLLINTLIRLNIGNNRIFDFEGSDLPGVAEYFKKFGPVNQPYLRIKHGLW